MAKSKITLVKSPIGSSKRQKATLTALGLTKMQKTVEKEMTPQINGMVSVVKHLVTVVEA